MSKRYFKVLMPITILGYKLTSFQNACLNHLAPSIFDCLVYILHFSTDLVLVYRHFLEDNAIEASLTLFFMYLPVLGCFTFIISSVELWPEGMQTCGLETFKWFLLKVFQHVLFPIWTMWRYAERIFWSIEGVRAKSNDDRDEALANLSAPRSIEFYFFLKGFLHAIPQILLQMHILMRSATKLQPQTVHLQLVSIFINIAVLAQTTTLYQRFKTQKMGGRNYPWYKPEKYRNSDRANADSNGNAKIVYLAKDSVSAFATNGSNFQELQDNSTNETSSNCSLEINQMEDWNASKQIKSLPEEDLAIKVVVFLWWYCFLIARFLAICTFAYFFPKDIVWILSSHFILCVAFLLHDSQAYVVRRTKAVFFILMGLIYIFVIVELKKRFTKAKLVYCVYFAMVFAENFVMCLLWRFSSAMNDPYIEGWWFKYVFAAVMVFSALSFISMVAYNVVKQPKVVIGVENTADIL